jgi:protein-L-isoaspartate O-methyltransferase
VRKAKDYLRKEGFYDVHFDVEDGAEITYEADMFDCVIDNLCVYANRLDAILAMYKGIYRTLKKGGRLFTVVIGQETDGFRTGNEIEQNTYENVETGICKDRGIVHFFTEEEIRKVLENIGFGNVKIDWMKYTDNGQKAEMYYVTAEKRV